MRLGVKKATTRNLTKVFKAKINLEFFVRAMLKAFQDKCKDKCKDKYHDGVHQVENKSDVNVQAVQGRMEPDFMTELMKWHSERYGDCIFGDYRDDEWPEPRDFPAFFEFFKDLLDIRDAEESAATIFEGR